MNWIQISFETPQESAEIGSDYLLHLGAVSVTFEDALDHPIFEPKVGTTPLWERTRVVGIFDESIDVTSLKTFLKMHLEHDFQTLKIEPLEDKDWIRASIDRFHPMQFGHHLWICPSWCEIPDPNAVTILLDPGLAFGTGTHPTTGLCLQWLEAHPPLQKTVIDYGCGSGILGIAALKLGAKEVYGVDCDPQALDSTCSNALKNDIETQHLHLSFPENFQIHHPIDLLLANILANPLIELASTFAQFIKTGGDIVLSGILETQTDSIINAYSPWFKDLSVVVQDEWVLIHGIRF